LVTAAAVLFVIVVIFNAVQTPNNSSQSVDSGASPTSGSSNGQNTPPSGLSTHDKKNADDNALDVFTIRWAYACGVISADQAAIAHSKLGYAFETNTDTVVRNGTLTKTKGDATKAYYDSAQKDSWDRGQYADCEYWKDPDHKWIAEIDVWKANLGAEFADEAARSAQKSDGSQTTEAQQSGDSSSSDNAAQEAPVTDCDRYAASNLDPQAKAQGVSFDKINSTIAIPACKNAVQQYPRSSRLIFQLGRAYDKNGDLSAALTQNQKAAGRGYALAQYNLGVMYEQGQGVLKNDTEAAAWYRKAADQGIAVSQFNLGNMYAKGRGITQNYSEAVKLFRAAANQGFTAAENSLGIMYAHGQGVAQNALEARKWFQLAANQGNAPAKQNLAELLKITAASKPLGKHSDNTNIWSTWPKPNVFDWFDTPDSNSGIVVVYPFGAVGIGGLPRQIAQDWKQKGETRKQTYISERLGLLIYASNIYFALGCRAVPVIQDERAANLLITQKAAALEAIYWPTAEGTAGNGYPIGIMDRKVPDLIRRAVDDGKERATRNGACADWNLHPEIADELRNYAEGTQN